MNKFLVATLAALALSGCASLDGKLENRISCTVAKDKAFFVSEYGPVGVAATIADADRQAICK